MPRATWRTTIASRNFYVHTYKRVLAVLVFSIMINLLLSLLIAYIYLGRTTPAYYVSNGMTSPMQIKPMDAPNESSHPLLASEPSTEGVKVIPE